MEVIIKTIKGIHTFWWDHTIQVISCKPWNPKLHPYPSLAKKMRTYLELEGQNVDYPSFNPVKLPMSSPHKNPVPQKSQDDKKKRNKTPLKDTLQLG